MKSLHDDQPTNRFFQPEEGEQQGSLCSNNRFVGSPSLCYSEGETEEDEDLLIEQLAELLIKIILEEPHDK